MKIPYKSKEKLPCFPTKAITWRKEKGGIQVGYKCEDKRREC